MYIVIICFSVCNIINFEINLSFLIKSFSYKTKKSEQKLKYLQKKKTFKVKWKVFFITFKGLSFKQIKPLFLKPNFQIIFPSWELLLDSWVFKINIQTIDNPEFFWILLLMNFWINYLFKRSLILRLIKWS